MRPTDEKDMLIDMTKPRSELAYLAEDDAPKWHHWMT